jgi:hypothetical protein
MCSNEFIKCKDKKDRSVPCAADDVDDLRYSESLRLEHSRAAGIRLIRISFDVTGSNSDSFHFTLSEPQCTEPLKTRANRNILLLFFGSEVFFRSTYTEWNFFC